MTGVICGSLNLMSKLVGSTSKYNIGQTFLRRRNYLQDLVIKVAEASPQAGGREAKICGGTGLEPSECEGFKKVLNRLASRCGFTQDGKNIR